MNLVKKITLNAVPHYKNSDAVTFKVDGTPLSSVYDVKWDFSEQQQFGVTRPTKVSFMGVDEAERPLIQATLAYFMAVYKTKHKERASRSQVTNWLGGLVYVVKGLQGGQWAALSDDAAYSLFKRRIKQVIQSKRLSKSKVDKIVTVLNKLVDSGLCQRHIVRREYVDMVTKNSQQHIAIPIRMYQTLVTQVLEVVETYHPHRHAIDGAYLMREIIYEEEKARTDVNQTVSAVNYRTKKRMDNHVYNIPNFSAHGDKVELGRIMTACAMVVLIFSGMRVGEMSSLSKSSYTTKIGTNIPILQGEETKRDGRVVIETWQTHPVAKDALELIYEATQHLRERYEAENNENLQSGLVFEKKHQHYARQIESAFLVVKSGSRTENYIMTNLTRMFNNWVEKSGIVATQEDVEEFDRLNPTRVGQLKVGGTLPSLSPHDFRRSFAVFFKRYGFGSSASIKFQYKHSNIQMSDYYGNNARLQAMHDVLLDQDLLNILNEESILMGVDAFDEIYNESEHLGGVGGKRIANDKFERLSQGEHVFMTRSEIERLVRNGTLSVVKLPTGGYCTNATCSRICGIGEFTTEIKPCDHQVITDKQAKVIFRQNNRLIKAFREMNTGDPMMNSILIAWKQKIKRNEQLVKDFNLSFESFNDKIKGIIETVEA